jgi:hypothetical protein
MDALESERDLERRRQLADRFGIAEHHDRIGTSIRHRRDRDAPEGDDDGESAVWGVHGRVVLARRDDVAKKIANRQ